MGTSYDMWIKVRLEDCRKEVHDGVLRDCSPTEELDRKSGVTAT